MFAAVSLKGAEDPRRDHGGLGFTRNHTSAGLGLGELTIGRAGAFGVDRDCAFIFQRLKDGFERFDVGVFTGDRNGVELVQCFAEPPFVEGVTSEVIKRALDLGADRRRIVKADVVGGEYRTPS